MRRDRTTRLASASGIVAPFPPRAGTGSANRSCRYPRNPNQGFTGRLRLIVAVWAADLVVAYFATTVGLELLRPDYLVDWRVFGFIATTAMATGVLTGLAPALRSTRIELARAIGSGAVTPADPSRGGA